MAVVRVRQHVNPLSRKYQEAIAPPLWEKVLSNPEQPLHLDIGCARGTFVLTMAQKQPEWNFLGLEIREPLVIQAKQLRDELGLTNLEYLFCNANNSLRPILASLPPNVLQRVSIQFPDPWFKKRHQRRRVVQPELVEVLATHLAPNGTVFLQSDVEPVAQEMVDRFQSHPAFSRQTPDWLPDNPMPVPTEREQYVLSQGLPVYRSIFSLNPGREPAANLDRLGGEG